MGGRKLAAAHVAVSIRGLSENNLEMRKALEAEFEDVSYLVGRVLSLSRLNDYSERFQKKYTRDIKAHDIYPEQFHIYAYYGIFLKIMEISLK